MVTPSFTPAERRRLRSPRAMTFDQCSSRPSSAPTVTGSVLKRANKSGVCPSLRMAASSIFLSITVSSLYSGYLFFKALQFPVYHHRTTVNLDGTTAHGNIEVSRRLALGKTIRTRRPHEVACYRTQLLAIEAARIVHVQGGPAGLGMHAPPRMRQGIDGRVVPTLEVIV